MFVVLTAPVGHGSLNRRQGELAVMNAVMNAVQRKSHRSSDSQIEYLVPPAARGRPSPPGHPAIRHRKVALAITIGVAPREGLEIIDLGFIIVNSVTMGFACYIVGTSPPGHPAIRHRKVALAIMIGVAILAWIVTFMIRLPRQGRRDCIPSRYGLTGCPEYLNGSRSDRAR